MREKTDLHVAIASHILWDSITLSISKSTAWATAWRAATLHSNKGIRKAANSDVKFAVDSIEEFARKSIAQTVANSIAEIFNRTDVVSPNLAAWSSTWSNTAVASNSAIEAAARFTVESKATDVYHECPSFRDEWSNIWKKTKEKAETVHKNYRPHKTWLEIERVAETAATKAAETAAKLAEEDHIQWHIVGYDTYIAAEKAVINYMITNNLWRELLVAAGRVIVQDGNFDTLDPALTEEEKNNPFLWPVIAKTKINSIHWKDFAVANSEKTPPQKMTTDEFLVRFDGKYFVRILNEDENYGFQYHNGLNEFKSTNSSYPKIPGISDLDGLYFTTIENIHRDYEFGTQVGIFNIPDGATITPIKGKFRANKLFLVGRLNLEEIQRYKLGDLNIDIQQKLREEIKSLELKETKEIIDLHVAMAHYILGESVIKGVGRYAAWATSWHAAKTASIHLRKEVAEQNAMMAKKAIETLANKSIIWLNAEAAVKSAKATNTNLFKTWSAAWYNRMETNDSTFSIVKFSIKSKSSGLLSPSSLPKLMDKFAIAKQQHELGTPKAWTAIETAAEIAAQSAAQTASQSAAKGNIPWHIVGCEAYYAAEKALLKHIIDQNLWKELLIAARRAIIQGGKFNTFDQKLTEEEKDSTFLWPVIMLR